MENKKIVFVGIGKTFDAEKGWIDTNSTQEEKDHFLENMKKGASEDTEIIYSDHQPKQFL